MTQFTNAMWRDMMGYLRQQHPTICRQWFEDLEPAGIESGLLKIRTGNNVQENYLQNKCLGPFQDAAQAVTGALVAVRFTSLPIEPVSVPVPKPAAAVSSSPKPTVATVATSVKTGRSKPEVVTLPEVPPPVAMPGEARNAFEEFRGDRMVLSPDYSFETFIAGPNNDLALAAAKAVADQPGSAYNPLFIHGGVGLGKTHLLQAICQQILHAKPDFHILYVSCDAFMNHFIDCVQAGQMVEFRKRYRHVDMLVIDDIHFLADKERTQEEFFHTFNELYQANKQIVLSSDAAPSEIPKLEDRLLSRFQWGLVAHVSKPSYETRVAILQAKAQLRGMTLDKDVLGFVANSIDSNARELEGAVTTLQAHSMLKNTETIDLALAHQALGAPAAPPRSNSVALQDIIEVVTKYYQVKLSDLQSRRRFKSITEPRQVCMWLARQKTRFSLEEIGGYFGGRDHTTVMHSIDVVEDRRKEDSTFARLIDQFAEQLSEEE